MLTCESLLSFKKQDFAHKYQPKQWRTISNFKEWRQGSEVYHSGPSFLPPSVQPRMQSHPTGAGQKVLAHPQTHFPGPRKTIWARTVNWCLQNDCSFLLVAGNFSKQEAKPGSFLTQFIPLPAQRGANCTSQSCPSRKIYPKRGQALLHNHPLSKSSPGRQLSSRDTPQPQLHSRDPWVWRNCHSSSIYGDTPSLFWLHQEGSQPFLSGKQAGEERCWKMRC